jgi:putative tryptophan/tyrosine transport system substrate-binding protein
MKRREFIGSLGGMTVWPLIASRAQDRGRVHRVAWVSTTSAVSELVGPIPKLPIARVFLQALRDLGYIEGKNLTIEWRSAEGKWEKLAEIIQNLVDENVDVIVAPANKVTQVAKTVTQKVPIVMMGNGSPVESGFVQSLARPGGNITGVAYDPNVEEVIPKRLQTLRELLPGVTHLAFLASRETEQWKKVNEKLARELGFDFLVADHAPTDYREAFALIAREKPGALLVASGADNYANRELIADFAARSQLPAMYGLRDYVDAGGLISYGPDSSDFFRRGAVYVDRILRGATPSDLPVEQSTRYELVINVKAAKAINLTIPLILFARADEVIE